MTQTAFYLTCAPGVLMLSKIRYLSSARFSTISRSLL